MEPTAVQMTFPVLNCVRVESERQFHSRRKCSTIEMHGKLFWNETAFNLPGGTFNARNFNSPYACGARSDFVNSRL